MATGKSQENVIRLNNVRLAFPNLFTAKAVKPGDKPGFSASFIMPKNHPDVAHLKAAIAQVAQAKWGAEWQAVLTALAAADRLCLHNGDAKSQYEGFAGNLYVNARTPTRPSVFDADPNHVLAEADGKPYAGCFVNARIAVWAMQNQHGKRINAQLRGVQFLRDGDAFGGGGVASPDEFDNVDNSADGPAPQAGATGLDGLF